MYIVIGISLLVLLSLGGVVGVLMLWTKLTKERKESSRLRQHLRLSQKQLNRVGEELEGVYAVAEQARVEAVEASNAAKKARANAALAVNEAEEASRAKSTFLATMSHEIRTPLNCIKGLSEVLMSTSPTEEQESHLQQVCLSVDSLLGIIGNVLDFSKIEAGKLDVRQQSFLLEEAVQKTFYMLKLQADQKGLRYRLELGTGSPLRVNADETHLRQILFNLLSNAIKFTDHGSVTLKMNRKREEKVEGRNVTPYTVSFEIADTGIGISPDQATELFTPFRQLVASRTRKYEGTGLGLCITKRLVEDGFSGSIAYRPNDNSPRGTIFEVKLTMEGFMVQKPLRAKAAGARALTKDGLYRHALGETFYDFRILVADDNRLNCLVMKAMLTKMGHTVSIVENGRQAIHHLKRFAVDIILMDIMMPLMDGIEATQSIRRGDAGEASKDLPIIAVTAFALADDRKEIMRHGFNHYLTKPVDSEQLRELFTAIAREKQVPAQGAAT